MRLPLVATLAFVSAAGWHSRCAAADGMLGVELVERNGKVVILKVTPKSGADGVLEAGDVLYKVGTTRIGTIQDALAAKASAANNTDIPFIIERNGSLYDFNGRFEKGQPYGKYSKPVLRKK